MVDASKAFSGFAVDDLVKAKQFYGETLGMELSERYGMLILRVAGGAEVLVYPNLTTCRPRSPC